MPELVWEGRDVSNPPRSNHLTSFRCLHISLRRARRGPRSRIPYKGGRQGGFLTVTLQRSRSCRHA